MGFRSSRVAQVEAVAATATVSVGWLVFARQLATDGWIAGGGTAVILVAACVGTLGGVIAILARRSGRHGWTALGLAMVALSPTVFAFVLNLAVLAFAVWELLVAVKAMHREPTTAQ